MDGEQWEEYSDAESTLVWSCLKVRKWRRQMLRYQAHPNRQAV